MSAALRQNEVRHALRYVLILVGLLLGILLAIPLWPSTGRQGLATTAEKTEHVASTAAH